MDVVILVFACLMCLLKYSKLVNIFIYLFVPLQIISTEMFITFYQKQWIVNILELLSLSLFVCLLKFILITMSKASMNRDREIERYHEENC